MQDASSAERPATRAERRRAPERRVALVRRPAPGLADGLLTHKERVSVDVDLASRQWTGYCHALADAGWQVQEVAPAPDHPDSVFVEDTVVMFGSLAVLTRPGAAERRGETGGTAEHLRGVPGIEVVAIQEPGSLEGGDVLKVGDTVYVGASSRTNAEGIRQLRALLAPRGYRVVAVPLTRALHLKSAVTALPDGTIIGFPPIVDAPSLFPHFLPVPEEEGLAVVVLDEETVLMSDAAPASAALVRSLGYAVVTVDIGEFTKLEGCVTCLSVRGR